jgi:hypothetical protein
VKHFFIHNGFFYKKLIEQDGPTYNLGKCKDGLLLGSLENNKTWIVHRTFISNKLMKEDQEEIAQSMMGNLQSQIKTALNIDTFNRNRYDYLTDMMMGIIN